MLKHYKVDHFSNMFLLQLNAILFMIHVDRLPMHYTEFGISIAQRWHFDRLDNDWNYIS